MPFLEAQQISLLQEGDILFLGEVSDYVATNVVGVSCINGPGEISKLDEGIHCSDMALTVSECRYVLLLMFPSSCNDFS